MTNNDEVMLFCDMMEMINKYYSNYDLMIRMMNNSEKLNKFLGKNVSVGIIMVDIRDAKKCLLLLNFPIFTIENLLKSLNETKNYFLTQNNCLFIMEANPHDISYYSLCCQPLITIWDYMKCYDALLKYADQYNLCLFFNKALIFRNHRHLSLR